MTNSVIFSFVAKFMISYHQIQYTNNKNLKISVPLIWLETFMSYTLLNMLKCQTLGKNLVMLPLLADLMTGRARAKFSEKYFILLAEHCQHYIRQF